MSSPPIDRELVAALERAARKSIPALDVYLIASARRQVMMIYLPLFLAALEVEGYRITEISSNGPKPTTDDC